MRTLQAYVKTLRLHQWTKNLLVFAALVFSKNLGDADLAWQAVKAFLAFCFLSSSVYIVNDLLDAKQDRIHPIKRFRPIASGQLGTRAALAGSLLLLVMALILGSRVGAGLIFIGALSGYFVLNLAYSYFLKP
jgi:4-hydroxybenzoate polyprenyltransferase